MPTVAPLSDKPLSGPCPVCGRLFVYYVPGRRGRQPDTCSAPCGRLSHALRELESAAPAVLAYATTDAFREIRGEVMRAVSIGRSLSSEMAHPERRILPAPTPIPLRRRTPKPAPKA